MKLVLPLIFASLSYIVRRFYQSDLTVPSFFLSTIMKVFTRGKLFPQNDPKSIQEARQLLVNSSPKIKNTSFNKQTLGIDDSRFNLTIYTPKIADNKFKGVLLWFHGGGFVMGSAMADDFIADPLAEQTGFIVVNVDYRLAPENKFPALYHDAIDALDWTIQNIKSFGGDPNNIILAGESAGGNLAASAAVYHASRNRHNSLLGCILIYPVLEYGIFRGSHFEERTRSVLSLDAMLWMWSLYLTEDQIRQGNIDERACPAWAPNKTLKRMCPTAFLLAQHDILRDEGVFFNDRLQENGVSTKLIQYDKTLHGVFNRLPIGKKAFEDVVGLMNELDTHKKFIF